jgi:predicted dehydrogenase
MSGDAKPFRFGLVGGGWRAEFFTRVAAALPERFQLVGVYQRDPAKAAAFARKWNTLACDTLDALADLEPDFVVVSVSAAAHLHFALELHRLNLPMLCETPAARDLPAMLEIWELVEKGLRLHVAEQYYLQPLHAARLAVIASGKLGTVSSVRVSAAHDYHGVSLMRRYLGIGFEPATIRARKFVAPVIAGPGREGPPAEEKSVPSTQLLGTFDFGDRLGLFDFTDVQYRSYVRSHHVVIRGERGEIADLDVRYLKDFRTPVVQELRRHDRGHFGDLDGYYLEGILCGDDYAFRNPYPYARLMDDEIAIAAAMEKMGAFARGEGAGPYAFAEAAQDQYLALAMSEAAATGEAITTTRQPWAS